MKYEHIIACGGAWQMNCIVRSLLRKFVSSCTWVGFAVTVMDCKPGRRQVHASTFTLTCDACAAIFGRT